MPRLPIPGSDAGNWGQILNDYLAQVHNADGSIKDNSIPETALASSVQTKTMLLPVHRVRQVPPDLRVLRGSRELPDLLAHKALRALPVPLELRVRRVLPVR